jgi:benzoyl-CoA reductase/2-hydroxyglutaryl-CoA dehydratase subunit BcrC/BadD/HgdB
MAAGHRRSTEILATFTETQEAPYPDWPDRYPGYRAMGYFCTYVPEEIIHATGFAPLRLRSGDQTPSRADAHLQSYACALCRSALDQALRGDLGFLQGVVLPDLYVETVVQPVTLSSPSTRPYLIAELQRFRHSLEQFTSQKISDQAISASVELYNEKRYLLTRLYDLRDRLTAPELFAATGAGFTMPVEEYNQLLGELVGLLAEGEQPPPKGPGLVLVGAVLDDPAILTIVEDLGARIVGDDLCTSSRYFAQPVETDGDPVAALADRYINRLPCPAKYHPDCEPGEHLLQLVSETQADAASSHVRSGVVFILQKFCDPHAFDYAMIKEKLAAAAVPYLRLEMEHAPALEQWRTRLQAFLEMIG